MLRPAPPDWAHALPGYGASRVLIDAALTPTFDETGPLLIALAWLAALTTAAAVLFRAPPPPPDDTSHQRRLRAVLQMNRRGGWRYRRGGHPQVRRT